MHIHRALVTKLQESSASVDPSCNPKFEPEIIEDDSDYQNYFWCAGQNVRQTFGAIPDILIQ